jgi:L-ribulose-5-phosphate 3-epimerase UlaE
MTDHHIRKVTAQKQHRANQVVGLVPSADRQIVAGCPFVVRHQAKICGKRDQVKSPWIQNGYDYSHYKLLGLSLRETLQQVASRTVFIHVKDSTGTPEKFRFLLPGDSGMIDYKEYAQILGEVGYRGPVTVEVSVHVSNQPGYDGLAAAKHSFDNLAPFFA